MRGNEFKVCAVDYQMSAEPDGTDIVRLHTDESSLPEVDRGCTAPLQGSH